MKRSRFTEEHIIGILKEHGAAFRSLICAGSEVGPFSRQIGGSAKVDSGLDYAASFSACSSIA